jgi:hypothetical protein
MVKKSFLAGILCIMLVFGLFIVGCDTGTNPGGGDEGGSIDSALVGTWYSTQTAADNGQSPMFEFTADGRLTGGAIPGDIKVTTSNGRISATITANGQTIDGGSADYVVNGTQLTFSNPSGGQSNIFATLSVAGSYYKSAGGNGNGSGDGNGASSNPFVGTWTGDGYTLTITESTWETAGYGKGTYTHTGNTATLTVTYSWDGGNWVPVGAGTVAPFTVTVSGDTLSGTGPDGNPITVTKESGNGNGNDNNNGNGDGSGDGNGSSNGEKPVELSSNATFDETIAKLDEIIAYSGTPADTKTAAQDLKDTLKSLESALKPAWSYAGASYLTLANNLIVTITDNSNNGNSGGDENGSGDGNGGGDGNGSGNGNLNITVGFNRDVLEITGSDGTNLIRQSSVDSLTLSAEGYTGVVWYVDGAASGISGNTLTIYAVDYTAQNHSVTFTGYNKNGAPCSQIIPFKVLN